MGLSFEVLSPQEHLNSVNIGWVTSDSSNEIAFAAAVAQSDLSSKISSFDQAMSSLDTSIATTQISESQLGSDVGNAYRHSNNELAQRYSSTIEGYRAKLNQNKAAYSNLKTKAGSIK
mgnify:CR=1 FL=1|jgi:hypothetical protein